MESLMPVIDVLIVPIAAVLSSTFFTKPRSALPTVSSNAVTFTTNPSLPSFIVSFNAVIALVLVATLDFKLPTVMEESTPTRLTSSAILPELIVVPVSVAPSDFAYALNAVNTVAPDTAFALPAATSPSG